MPLPPLPEYGRGTLADLLPSLGARLGLPDEDRLGLPSAESYLVLLVDGLGFHQLRQYAEHAPYLAGLGERTLRSCVPSTTATALTSLGTGLVPGRHGIAGYSFWYGGEVLNTLKWPASISGLDVQPQLTYFERLAASGVRTATVAPAKFAGSGLTTAALRGPAFLPVHDETDLDRRVELCRQAVAGRGRALGYCYERALDHAGHAHGVGSPAWLAALKKADDLARRLRSGLGEDVRLLVTGDHGMVDVPGADRVMFEDEPELRRGVRFLFGEGRLRQVRCDDPDAVAERWRQRLGERAWVRTRAEAVADGWFGDVSPRLADRFGDVLVAMRGTSAVMSRVLAKELDLVGMHGSLTEAELDVPLLID